jgi:hypothetical protein
VSIASALRSRATSWHDVLHSFGYRVLGRSLAEVRLGTLEIRAERPEDYGGPEAAVEIYELWREGDDPDALGTEHEGCFLAASSWHAQITPTGDLGAERLDLDRSKPAALLIHRHPYGSSNAVRVPAAPLIVPAQWLVHLEELIYDEFFADR